MRTYFTLFIEAFLLAYVFTPLAIHLFARWGFVDMPDGVRKMHTTPVPRLGGLVLVASIAVTLCSLWMVPNVLGSLLRVSLATMLKFLAPAFLVLIIGAVDDIRPVRPVLKLAVQTLAASLVWLQGISITVPYVDPLGTPWLSSVASYLVTVVWIIAITNAINLIDGLDGLAAPSSHPLLWLLPLSFWITPQ